MGSAVIPTGISARSSRADLVNRTMMPQWLARLVGLATLGSLGALGVAAAASAASGRAARCSGSLVSVAAAVAVLLAGRRAWLLGADRARVAVRAATRSRVRRWIC